MISNAYKFSSWLNFRRGPNPQRVACEVLLDYSDQQRFHLQSTPDSLARETTKHIPLRLSGVWSQA
jgi:hypothetical protein